MEASANQGPSPGPSARWTTRWAKHFHQRVWVDPMPAAWTPMGGLLRVLRTLHLILRGLWEVDLRLHASALTFSTLLALAPILALSLGLVKGLGYGTELTDLVRVQIQEMPAQFQNYVHAALDAVEHQSFAKIGGIGGLVLLLMVVQMLTRIERSFNRVWGVKNIRSLVRRITNYISVVVVVPLLVISGMTVSAQFNLDSALVQPLGLARILPLLMVWLAFWFLYGAIPNTRVRWIPAMVSGFIGALLWMAWFQLYITVQPGVTRYNTLYGALASLPIFLAWVYISWLIVLIGGKVTHAVQNRDTWRPGVPAGLANPKAQALIALAILRDCVRSMGQNGARFSKAQFIAQTHAPSELVGHVLDRLERQNLIVEVANTHEDQWVLTQSPDRLQVATVVTHLLNDGATATDLGITLNAPELEEALDNVLCWLDEGSVPLSQLAPASDQEDDDEEDDDA